MAAESKTGRDKDRDREREEEKGRENKAQRLYLIKNLPHACKMLVYKTCYTLCMAKNFGQRQTYAGFFISTS